MKYCCIALAFFYSTIVALAPSLEHKIFPSIFLISIPKSGTHLAVKCLRQFVDMVPQGFPSALDLPRTNQPFCFSHVLYSPKHAATLLEKHYKMFLIYRDPRDQIISYIFYMKKNAARWPKISTMSFDEAIFDMIYENSLSQHSLPTHGIADLYQKYLAWRKVPGVYALRFEDLVGAQGGGSDAAQLALIKKMVRHLNIDVDDEKIQMVAANLYGSSPTFREGKIGSWKKYFTEEHKRAFKEVAGQLLIDLGYEKDMNW